MAHAIGGQEKCKFIKRTHRTGLTFNKIEADASQFMLPKRCDSTIAAQLIVFMNKNTTPKGLGIDCAASCWFLFMQLCYVTRR